MTFEQFWRDNEAELAARFFHNSKWNVYALAREVYERAQKGRSPLSKMLDVVHEVLPVDHDADRAFDEFEAARCRDIKFTPI